MNDLLEQTGLLRDAYILDQLKMNCAMAMAFNKIHNESEPSIHVATYIKAIIYLEELMENRLSDGNI